MIPEKMTVRLPGAVFLIAVATSALGMHSCAYRSADAISAATTALPTPAESPGQTRVLMILAASSAGSTAKVARARLTPKQ